MSENKRYTYNPYELWIIDNKRDKEYYSIEEVVGLLNEKEERIRELEKENELKGDFRNFVNEEIVQIKKENQRLIKMLDNVANYMQKQHKDMPIDDFVEWWNDMTTEGL